MFVPQMVFSVQGQPVLFGTLKSGELKNGMFTVVNQKTLTIMKLEGRQSNRGITLSGLNVQEAQNLINKELEFLNQGNKSTYHDLEV